MKRVAILTTAVLVLLIAGLGVYLAGVRAGRAQAKGDFGGALASVQADLGASNLQRLRELESDLSRGCSKEALAKVRFDIDSQLYVLASLYREYKGSGVMENVARRAPTLPAQLEGFKKQYGQSWTEPKCPA